MKLIGCDAPTAAKCPGNKPASDIGAKPIPPDVTPAAAPEPPPAPEPPTRPALAPPAGVTAKCQDCPRCWNLTGIVLRSAVEMHELKHGHIVNILEDEIQEDAHGA